MDNKKDDSYYLGKIIVDLKFLIKHTFGKKKREIECDEVLLDSIMFRLIQISENSDKLTSKFKNKNTNFSWREIKGLRNRIVHDYGYIDMTIIYDTVTKDIPNMYEVLKEFEQEEKWLLYFFPIIFDTTNNQLNN